MFKQNIQLFSIKAKQTNLHSFWRFFVQPISILSIFVAEKSQII